MKYTIQNVTDGVSGIYKGNTTGRDMKKLLRAAFPGGDGELMVRLMHGNECFFKFEGQFHLHPTSESCPIPIQSAEEYLIQLWSPHYGEIVKVRNSKDGESQCKIYIGEIATNTYPYFCCDVEDHVKLLDGETVNVSAWKYIEEHN